MGSRALQTPAPAQPTSSSPREVPMPAPERPWNDLVKDYLRERRRSGTVNPVSAQSYRSVLGRLAAGLEGAGVPLDAHTDQLLDAVAGWIDAQEWSRTTRCTNLGI